MLGKNNQKMSKSLIFVTNGQNVLYFTDRLLAESMSAEGAAIHGGV